MVRAHLCVNRKNTNASNQYAAIGAGIVAAYLLAQKAKKKKQELAEAMAYSFRPAFAFAN